MKRSIISLLAASMFAGVSLPAFSQAEFIEHLPDSTYVANWEPIYRNRIVSYVQLPGDSSEYKKVKIYVFYRPIQSITQQEEFLKYRDLRRQRYLGAVLIRTGRTFSKLLDDSVLGVENLNLRVEDQLINNEALSARGLP
jgi:hypothetical protein